MFRRPFAAVAGLTFAAFLAATPAMGQSTATPSQPVQHNGAHMSREDVVAFAKLSISVAQVRDSVQKQLTLARNKTPQMQQQLREQLASGVEEVLKLAGVSDEEYRHKTFLVSTDS